MNRVAVCDRWLARGRLEPKGPIWSSSVPTGFRSDRSGAGCPRSETKVWRSPITSAPARTLQACLGRRRSTCAPSAAMRPRAGPGAVRAAASGTRSSSTYASRGGTCSAGAGGAGRGRRSNAAAVKPVTLREVAADDHRRLSTGIGELDSVLGGWIVPASLVLLGGVRLGSGKSTLTTMVLANPASSTGGGLRSMPWPRSRRRRSGCARSGSAAARRWRCAADRRDRDLHTVLATLEQERPEVCVIDSVQTLP